MGQTPVQPVSLIDRKSHPIYLKATHLLLTGADGFFVAAGGKHFALSELVDYWGAVPGRCPGLSHLAPLGPGTDAVSPLGPGTDAVS